MTKKDFSLRSFTSAKRFSAAEYSFLISGVEGQINAFGVEGLDFPSGVFDNFQALGTKLKDLVRQSKVSKETAKIQKIEEEIDDLLVAIIGVIRSTMKSPVANKKEVSTELYNAIGTYGDAYRKAMRYKMGLVDSLLYDLAKPELSELVSALGLDNEVESLTLKHAQCKVLMDSRSNAKVKISKDKTRSIRKEIDQLLEIMVTCIRSLYYKTPTDELGELILSLNQLLAESETSYNQRMAHTKKKEDGEEEEDAGNSDSSENSGDSEAPEPSDSSEQ
jgi:hypothetical protein